MAEDLLELEDEVSQSETEKNTVGLLTKQRVFIVIGILGGLTLLASGVIFFKSGDKVPSYKTPLNISELSSLVQPEKAKATRKKKVRFTTLYKQLSGVQLAEILRELSFEEITFDVNQNGKQFDIAVDQTRVEDAKTLLAIKGLPTGGAKGYEIFDNASNLGVTEFDKRIRLVRALSGQMEKAIIQLDAIDNAQVEIVIPETRLFSATQPPVTASIIVKLSKQIRDSDELVYAIIQMVANSVENLQPSNISVIDTLGRVLSEGVLDKIAKKKKTSYLKSSRKTLTVNRLGKSGKIVLPSMTDVINWFELKHNYEQVLEKKAISQLSTVLPQDGYKLSVTIDLSNTTNVEIPDVKRLTASILIDENVVELDAYMTKKIQNVIAGAIGYVRGRDMIYLSSVEFSRDSFLDDEPSIDKKEAIVINTKDRSIKYFKYWPIIALGLSMFIFLYGLFRSVKKIVSFIVGERLQNWANKKMKDNTNLHLKSNVTSLINEESSLQYDKKAEVLSALYEEDKMLFVELISKLVNREEEVSL